MERDMSDTDAQREVVAEHFGIQRRGFDRGPAWAGAGWAFGIMLVGLILILVGVAYGS